MDLRADRLLPSGEEGRTMGSGEVERLRLELLLPLSSLLDDMLGWRGGVLCVHGGGEINKIFLVFDIAMISDWEVDLAPRVTKHTTRPPVDICPRRPTLDRYVHFVESGKGETGWKDNLW